MNPAPDYWKSLTHAGNDRFQQSDLPGAIRDYRRALDYTLRHPTAWFDACDALAARVVSALNLSEAQLGNSRIGDACDTLCDTHEYLLTLSHSNDTPFTLRDAAFHHQAETFAALTRIHRAYGSQPEVDTALRPFLRPTPRVFHARPPRFTTS